MGLYMPRTPARSGTPQQREPSFNLNWIDEDDFTETAFKNDLEYEAVLSRYNMYISYAMILCISKLPDDWTIGSFKPRRGECSTSRTRQRNIRLVLCSLGAK